MITSKKYVYGMHAYRAKWEHEVRMWWGFLREASMKDVEKVDIEITRVGILETTLVIMFYQDMKNSQRFQSVFRAKKLS
jgi:hypothetical protein